MARPRVMIIGAGFGGLTAAQALARETVDITVIDIAKACVVAVTDYGNNRLSPLVRDRGMP